MTVLAFGILGLIIGSFLNVLVLRRGVKPLTGRSECPSCGAQIAWYDNIPVLSWIILRGRCRNCLSSISVQYPIVEAVTGILFALESPLLISMLQLPFPIAHFFIVDYLLITALLIAIAVYDLRTTIIPNQWVYSFIALALVAPFFSVLDDSFNFTLYILAGPIAALPLFLLWLVSSGKWMGFGDVKLALGMGWLLGPVGGAFAVFFAFIIGALFFLPALALSSEFLAQLMPRALSRKSAAQLTIKSEVPFGPFLIASTFFVWILGMYGIDVVSYLFPVLWA